MESRTLLRELLKASNGESAKILEHRLKVDQCFFFLLWNGAQFSALPNAFSFILLHFVSRRMFHLLAHHRDVNDSTNH